MIKKWSYFLGLALIIAVVSSGFRASDENFKKVDGFHLAEGEVYHYTVEEKTDDNAAVTVPYTGKTFTGFKQAIAVKESLGLYKLVNPYGYMGKYQFGKRALRAIGITDTNEFLNDPVLQEKAFKALLSKNKWFLRREIAKYSGKTIKGTTITESGILAAAHLAGAGSVKRYLNSNGNIRFRDGFGTSLRSYIKKFGGYDTSNIKAKPDPTVIAG